jgi:calcineurin-like phosphoesterase family protein
MRTYFTADQHFNCPGLVKETRPWTTPEDHDDYVLDCLNTFVQRRDRLFILGDMCKGRPFKWREKIVCRDVWFILGNHDHRTQTEKAFGVGRVRESMMVRLNKECRVYCSHYPHAHWPSSHHGVCHAYGHIHSQRERELDQFYPQRRSLDVGVDNAIKFYGKPYPFPQEFFTDVIMSHSGHDMVK